MNKRILHIFAVIALVLFLVPISAQAKSCCKNQNIHKHAMQDVSHNSAMYAIPNCQCGHNKQCHLNQLDKEHYTFIIQTQQTKRIKNHKQSSSAFTLDLFSKRYINKQRPPNRIIRVFNKQSIIILHQQFLS